MRVSRAMLSRDSPSTHPDCTVRVPKRPGEGEGEGELGEDFTLFWPPRPVIHFQDVASTFLIAQLLRRVSFAISSAFDFQVSNGGSNVGVTIFDARPLQSQ